MEVTQKISGRLLTYINNGLSLEEAFNAVLGPGYYECLVSDLYDELRK